MTSCVAARKSHERRTTMSKWMSDEEIEEMKRARPLTGNDFVDAYHLGFDAGSASRQNEVDKEIRERSEYYWAKDKAEKRVKELEAENEKLRKKVAKLKKRCKALAGAE